MTLSLLPLEVGKVKPVHVGEEVNVTVCKVNNDGIEVQVKNKNLQAFIPLHHISVSYDLNSALLSRYQI